MGGVGYFKMSFQPIVEAFAAIIIRGYNARRDFCRRCAGDDATSPTGGGCNEPA